MKNKKRNPDYLKDFSLVSKGKNGWRCYFVMWAIITKDKVELVAVVGIEFKTKKQAVERTWKKLKKDLDKNRVSLNGKYINFISIAPVLIIPRNLKKSVKWYIEETEEEVGEVGSVERPTAEEIAIENDPRTKAEYKDTEKLMEKAEKKK